MAPTDPDLKVAKPETTGMTMSEAAAAKLTSLAAQEDESGLALRVTVQPSGCSGFSYDMYFDAEISDDDHVSTSGEMKLIVDPASAPHVQGAVLDFDDGLTDGGFMIDNPNATQRCGCGKNAH